VTSIHGTDLFMEPALEAGVLRELCLVLSVLLNIARPPYRFFHAAMQHSLGVGASLALFSNQGPAPLVRWWTRRKWREQSGDGVRELHARIPAAAHPLKD